MPTLNIDLEHLISRIDDTDQWPPIPENTSYPELMILHRQALELRETVDPTTDMARRLVHAAGLIKSLADNFTTPPYMSAEAAVFAPAVLRHIIIGLRTVQRPNVPLAVHFELANGWLDQIHLVKYQHWADRSAAPTLPAANLVDSGRQLDVVAVFVDDTDTAAGGTTEDR